MEQDGARRQFATSLGGIVLIGGGAARLGGADKAGIEIGGRTLLERALDALVDATEVVVVGDYVLTNRPVTFRREDPAGGGPAAGVMAGLTGFARMPEQVVVLAVDMPLVSASTVSRLRNAASDDGAVLVDADGRRQHLCAVYDTAMLRASGAGDVHGMSMHGLLSGMDLAEVAAVGREAVDVDTWDDLRLLREELG